MSLLFYCMLIIVETYFMNNVMSEVEVYSNSIIKPSNNLISAIYRLETNELKVILLAAKMVYQLEKRNEVVTPETEFIISSSEYAKEYNVSRQTAFDAIVDAKNKIFERSISYFSERNGEILPTRSRWLSKEIESQSRGEIYIYFTAEILPLIYLVEKEFTLIDLQELGRLNSKYAIKLYQLLMKWRNADFQPKFEYEDLRAKLGLIDEDVDTYRVMSDFKKRVIDMAVRQINKGTGFVNLKYVTEKNRGKVTHFQFLYDFYDNKTINITPLTKKQGKTNDKTKKGSNAPKQAQQANNGDSGANDDGFVLRQQNDGGLSPAQAFTFASKIVAAIEGKDERFNDIRDLAEQGEGFEAFTKRIASDLLNGNIELYKDGLKLVGFKGKGI